METWSKFQIIQIKPPRHWKQKRFNLPAWPDYFGPENYPSILESMDAFGIED
jgi:hypothetical protein